VVGGTRVRARRADVNPDRPALGQAALARSAVDRLNLDLAGPLPTGRVVVEASAGTGKTFTLTALVVRHIIERSVPIDQVLVVTFTRAAANELRDRTRSVLSQAAAVLAAGAAPEELPWMTVLLSSDPAESRSRLARAEQALASFDDATITTIHGFCQQALGLLGVRSGADPQATFLESVDEVLDEVCRDLLLDALADDPGYLSDEHDAGRVESALRNTVRTLLANPDAQRVPEVGVDAKADRWSRLVDSALVELRARLAQRRAVSYDQLITGLRDALAHPTRGPAVAAQLAARYAVVLVDEFQDTDPVQWEVFERAFGSAARASGHTSLVTVGDPKQAIYRFRGADVHAYLEAVDGVPVQRLAVNYRSDAGVLAGIACLFDGAELGDERIRFLPVAAARDGGHSGEPAVMLRLVPDDDTLLNASGNALAMPATRNLVLADLANRVIELLRRWQPEDIAVLVPSHSDAASVADVLRRAKVPAVRTRTGSVLHSEAVMQWHLLLAALAQPSRSPVVRAAALGWLLPTDTNALAGPEADQLVAELQARCGQMAWQLHDLGVGAFFDMLRAQPDVIDSVLGQPDGQRCLTDLEHIAELLAERLHGQPCEPAMVLRALDELRADDDPRMERTMRRIESDALAVQITTIHAAKGLEYPVVLMPFGFKGRPFSTQPYTFSHDGAGVRRRTIDVASLIEWKHDKFSQRHRKERSEVDTAGDQLRLLYVAVTRARHHLDVWWANTWRASTSALAAVLLDRDRAQPARNTARFAQRHSAESMHSATAQIEALAADSDGALGLVRLPPMVTPSKWSGMDNDTRPPLAVASAAARAPLADESWRTWSFTAVTRLIDDEVHLVGAPTMGGFDEPPDDLIEQFTRSAPTVPLADVAGGAAFGTMVHAVLEQVDLSGGDVAGELIAACHAEQQRSGLDVDAPTVAAGLQLATHTPLGAAFEHRSLAHFASVDRLAEVSFDLPLGRVVAADIGRVLAEHLAADDPLRSFAAQLGDDLADVQLAGWLTGSIDALIRVSTASGTPHFVVVDYKTNRLHQPGDADPLAAYGQEGMLTAMLQHHYPLQALLYMVAVHRFLGVRMGSRYRPDEHLGGAAYLFVRGMVGPTTPVVNGVRHGVFSWRPPAAAVVAVDDLLAARS
jgi:exodeoxyribonuclease V beta subunit